MTSRELAFSGANFALSKKAKDVQILNISAISDVTDFFVVCSGDSDTHVKAIADAIEDGLRDIGVRVHRKEGYQAMLWILLDFFDVVVHVFQQRTRDFYQIERLWGDAEITFIRDEQE
jgi:ribosome-associated protein